MYPDQRVGPYVLIEKLGAGGLGEVWKARDPRLNRIVALKFLTAEQSGTSSPRELLREARAASALNHPNIVTIFDVGESEGHTYLAMEFVEGETLRARLKRGPVPLAETLEIAQQVVAGLAAAHRHGIIHRDLKPENVMLRVDGYVKLLDFGLAKRLPGAAAEAGEPTVSVAMHSGHVVGTLTYMSPEQARAQSVTPASDIFAVGILLYEMLAGEHPFRRESAMDTLSAILNAEPTPLTKRTPEASAEVARVVERALSKASAQRYPSAVELSEDLKRARAEGPAPPTVRRRPRWVRAIGAAVIALALGVGVWQFGLKSDGEIAGAVRTVAVMNFRSEADDARAAALARGLPEELSGALVARGIRVAAGSSVEELGAAVAPRAVGAQLGVDGVLLGTVRSYGNKFRVYVELVDSRTGFQVWSKTFVAESGDLLGAEQKTAAEIAAELRDAVTKRP